MAEQDFLSFHKSITKELATTKDRVRNLVKHWGEDGRYKEAILRNVLLKFLPKTYSIGTGFVVNSGREVTNQIDLIVYDSSTPLLFSEGDFVIVPAHSVRAIIEVKTKIESTTKLNDVIKKSEANASKISSIMTENRALFNGIFAYDCELTFNTLETSLANYFSRSTNIFRKVNHICLGSDKFVKLWTGKPNTLEGFELKELSFSYFIFNLLKTIDENKIPYEHDTLWFPFPSKAPHSKFIIEERK